VISVGVSGPGVVKKAIDRAVRRRGEQVSITEIAEIIKTTAFKVTKVGQLIGTEVAEKMNLPFGVADLSLAPTPEVGDSVGEIFQSVGLSSIGAPGSTAVLAMLNDAVKKGGVFASSSVGGLSGAFIPVSEDAAIADAASKGLLTLEKLEAMTCVCSVGLDMIAIPGDTPADVISAIIADESAIGMINAKTTAVRLIPVPGKTVGERAEFGGLLGGADIMAVQKLKTIDDLLAKAGSDKEHILRCTVYLPNMGYFSEMNQAWEEWVSKSNPPARSVLESALPDPSWKVQISTVAVVVD